jgi:invasion protein IalB
MKTPSTATWLLGMATVVLVVVSTSTVAAQQRPAQRQAAPQPVEATGPSSGWLKVCQSAGETEACVIQQDTYADDGSLLAGIAVQEIRGNPRRRVVMTLPHGLWIEDGVQLRVDQRAPIAARFDTCLTNGCFAAVNLTPELLQHMRQGQRIVLGVRPPDGSVIHVVVPLAGFGQAYDGAAASPAVLQAHQERFEAEIQRRRAAAQPSGTSGTPGGTPGGGPVVGPALQR